MKMNKFIPILLALVMLTGVFSLSAYAYTPPDADTGASPAPSPGKQTQSAVPTTGNTITPSGTSTVVDKLSSKDGKEFYTITTPDENVFYLVIDTVRDGENVYFLNAVTEDDLMALAEKKEDGKDGTSTSAIPGQSPAPQETEPSPSPDPETKPPEQNDGGNGTLIFIIIAAIVAGGAGYYFKIVRPKQQSSADETEDDFEDYDESSEDDGGYETDEESEDE